jgi:hypothetical protein
MESQFNSSTDARVNTPETPFTESNKGNQGNALPKVLKPRKSKTAPVSESQEKELISYVMKSEMPVKHAARLVGIPYRKALNIVNRAKKASPTPVSSVNVTEEVLPSINLLPSNTIDLTQISESGAVLNILKYETVTNFETLVIANYEIQWGDQAPLSISLPFLLKGSVTNQISFTWNSPLPEGTAPQEPASPENQHVSDDEEVIIIMDKNKTTKQ